MWCRLGYAQLQMGQRNAMPWRMAHGSLQMLRRCTRCVKPQGTTSEEIGLVLAYLPGVQGPWDIKCPQPCGNHAVAGGQQGRAAALHA